MDLDGYQTSCQLHRETETQYPISFMTLLPVHMAVTVRTLGEKTI